MPTHVNALKKLCKTVHHILVQQTLPEAASQSAVCAHKCEVSGTHDGRDSEVSFMHLVHQPINFSSSVDKDDSLGNCQCLV